MAAIGRSRLCCARTETRPRPYANLDHFTARKLRTEVAGPEALDELPPGQAVEAFDGSRLAFQADDGRPSHPVLLAHRRPRRSPSCMRAAPLISRARRTSPTRQSYCPANPVAFNPATKLVNAAPSAAVPDVLQSQMLSTSCGSA